MQWDKNGQEYDEVLQAVFQHWRKDADDQWRIHDEDFVHPPFRARPKAAECGVQGRSPCAIPLDEYVEPGFA